MLQLINDLPVHVVGVKATGPVTKADYQRVMEPALQASSDTYGELYLLMVIDTPISEFKRGALWEDIKTGFSHFTKWKKIAVVTDSVFIEKLTDVVTFLNPGSAKGFKMYELEEARRWVSEKMKD